MRTPNTERQHAYLAAKNSQINIIKGSYSLRLAVLNHPLIEGEVSINMGIAKEGNVIDTGYFYNKEETWKVQFELIPLNENCEHQLTHSGNLSIDNLIGCLLNMFVQDESSLLYSQQVKHPIPNTIVFENLDTVPNGYHFNTTKNCIS